MSDTWTEKDSQRAAGKALARFGLGRKADNAAALAAQWAQKAGTWSGLAQLLNFLPASSSWHVVKETIKTWGRAAKPDAHVGEKAATFARDFYSTQLGIASAVLGSSEGQAALTAAGVPPELTAALGAAAQAGSDALGGISLDAAVTAAVDAADPASVDPADPGWFEEAETWIMEHPIQTAIGLAALALGGWRALR